MDWKFEKNMYPILDTRVECKVRTSVSSCNLVSIRICPDWNVKDVYIMQKGGWSSIRICPDWNVKADIYIINRENVTISVVV